MALTFERHSGGTPDNATVTNISTVIAPVNQNRSYLLIQNDSDATVYLALNAAAELGKGIRLNAGGGSYEINFTNLFTGAVHAITASGSKNVCIQEGY
jgi:hypothetical protein